MGQHHADLARAPWQQHRSADGHGLAFTLEIISAIIRFEFPVCVLPEVTYQSPAQKKTRSPGKPGNSLLQANQRLYFIGDHRDGVVDAGPVKIEYFAQFRAVAPNGAAGPLHHPLFFGHGQKIGKFIEAVFQEQMALVGHQAVMQVHGRPPGALCDD
jgi:hypothetical protein